jgi:hypothetical protein
MYCTVSVGYNFFSSAKQTRGISWDFRGEMPHYVFCPPKKISRTFRISGTFIVHLSCPAINELHNVQYAPDNLKPLNIITISATEVTAP